MGEGSERVIKKIQSFKRKYYLNIFIKGAILSLSILFSYFLLVAIIEHNLWLGPWARFLAFFTFFAVAAFCIYRFLKEPLEWWLMHRGLSEEESARIIGKYIPKVQDRLINFIQLSSSKNDSALAYASLLQKSNEFEPISFDTIIDIRQNKKYLKFLMIPVVVILALLALNQSIITESTSRILHFNRQYSPKAPFVFTFENTSLTAFYNEDFTLRVKINGASIPSNVYLQTGNQRHKLIGQGNNQFVYTFEKIQEPVNFQLEAAGFFSEENEIVVVNRPELLQFNVELTYPRYLQLKNEKLVNAGNLEVPEGTVIKWKLSTANAENASISFNSDSVSNDFQVIGNEEFTFKKAVKESDQYEIALVNRNSVNKDKIAYGLDVIKDQFPQIVVKNLEDSVLFKRVMLGGSVGDDYGISQLTLVYQIQEDNQNRHTGKIDIPVSRQQVQQSFYYNWSLDSLKLKPGQQLEYYLQVWDNDGVNGRKSTKSASYTFLVPTENNLIGDIHRSQSQTQQKIDQSVGKANKLQDQIEQASQKLKGKQTLDWQDKKMLEDIIQQKNTLNQAIDQLKDQNKLLEEKKEAFTEQDDRIKQKAEQIQKLMDELLDEETKKLFEELQKLLKQNTDVSQMQKLLDKLNQNTNNLEKELERTLELFKELQYEFKLDQTVQNLKNQIESQKSLLEKTEDLDNRLNNKEQKGQQNKTSQKENASKNNDKDRKDKKGEGDNKDQDQPDSNNESEKLAEEQEKLNEEFKESEKQIEDLKKLGEELNKNEDLPSQEETNEIEQEQQQSKEMLKQNQPSKAKTPQQKAMQKMQKMQEQIEGAQNSMMMEMDMQNIESLRQIIHGLVKLSFDQEGLMKQFAELNQSDPRFNTLAQQQMKLKDDAAVLEDSLMALANKDPFMGSIVTKEVGELNSHLDKVISANRERKRPQAASEMQASMTSINNLALMLDDHFDMMMQMMANAQPSMRKSKQKGQKPSLGQMQQQLNQRIQELKNGGKSGRELSEELAEMAAEQERIRKALQEMQNKMKDGSAPGGNQIPAKMEQTEMDLVNKQLTDQLIKRQQEILTRLLETEKSMREQDMDEERKGETAKDYDKEMPKAFEEYLRQKEKEVELLKTVPPKLYPYYKKEVSEYFKRMGNQ